jgi:hypothetical protein
VAPLRLGGLRGKQSTPSVWLGGTGELSAVGEERQGCEIGTERGTSSEAGEWQRYDFNLNANRNCNTFRFNCFGLHFNDRCKSKCNPNAIRNCNTFLSICLGLHFK